MLHAFDHICMEKARYKFLIIIFIIIIIIIKMQFGCFMVILYIALWYQNV